MIQTAELAKAIAQAEQAREKKSAMVAKIMRSINDAEGQIAQLVKQDQTEAYRAIELLKVNDDLRQRNAALSKALMDERSRANRLEVELSKKMFEYQDMIVRLRKEKEGSQYWIAAEDYYDERKPTRQQKLQENKERMIAMSTILSFGSTRMTQESVQTIVDLLSFAINNSTPEEDKILKKLIVDFRKALRPQMDVKDSTQNFYMK